jgi:hypothetical protein
VEYPSRSGGYYRLEGFLAAASAAVHSLRGIELRYRTDTREVRIVLAARYQFRQAATKLLIMAMP